LNEHPDDKAKFAATMLSEEPSSRGRQGTAETFFNRMISHGIPPDKMMSSAAGLRSGRGVYYQPLRPGGTYGRSAAALEADPALRASIFGDIDRAGAGSNISDFGTQNASAGVAGSARRLQTVTGEEVRGSHDLWSRKDVHPEVHGAGTVAMESAWYAAASREARNMVDRRSVKTVKVDATGKVAVNIGASGGSDATLGSERLFKPTGPERSTQMMKAETGPATFSERFSGTSE
jgi:hypothetical protein